MAAFKHLYLNQAKVQAFRQPVLHFVGGVVFEDADSPDVAPLRHSRYWRPFDSSAKDANYDAYLPGQYIYGGPLYHHFGHFVAEMIHRIMPGRQIRPDWRLLFMAPLSQPGAPVEVPPYIAAVLDFFGLSLANIEIANRDTIVEDLLVVESGSDFGGGPKPGYTDLLETYTPGRIAQAVPEDFGSGNLYVSRSKIMHGGSYLGEKYLERWLATAGFKTIFPEDLPYLHQIKYYASADTVVFCEGSACHGAEVLGTRGLNNCVLLGRRQNHLDIFSRILRSRSRTFNGSVCGPDLGPVVGRTVTGEPLPNFSVSLLDPALITHLLRSANVAPAAPFNVPAYIEEAERDLLAHLSYHDQRPSPLYEPLFSREVREKFDIAVGEIKST